MNPSPSQAAWLPAIDRRPKLLIVDDQQVNILLLNELFQDDCEVFMATQGEGAIAMSQNLLPDLILLDVVMPGADGYEICRRLKADPLTCDIPIIFITVQNGEEDQIRGLELGAVDFISKPISPVIVRARVRTHLALKLQSDMLRAIALLDGLTGVGNRRQFDQDMQVAWRICLREQAPLSLIMVDVDLFKRYNDRYGHLAGDLCLKSVAGALHQSLQRPWDTLARYGGEEFICLLPKTEAQGAATIAAKLLQRIRSLEIEHLDSDVDSVVTISQGVATTIPRPGQVSDTLIAAADRQLYQAKQAGRAQACFTEL